MQCINRNAPTDGQRKDNIRGTQTTVYLHKNSNIILVKQLRIMVYVLHLINRANIYSSYIIYTDFEILYYYCDNMLILGSYQLIEILVKLAFNS